MWARTEDLVELLWPQIELLVRAVLEGKTMPGADVRRLVYASL